VPARRNEVKEGEYTWYAYDAGGMPMAVYKQSFVKQTATTATMHFDVEEQDVYGSGRLGVRHGDEEGKYSESWTNITMNGNIYASYTVASATAGYVKTHYTRELGKKQYEIANHLGNVLVTVSDKRLGYAANSNATVVDWYTADVVSFTDYYVFGAPQTGRAGGEYRYGFNGMEQNAELKGQGLAYTTDYREYDPRVGRWFSKDPVVHPQKSPYNSMSNNPITMSDKRGANDGWYSDENGELHFDERVHSQEDMKTYGLNGNFKGEEIDTYVQKPNGWIFGFHGDAKGGSYYTYPECIVGYDTKIDYYKALNEYNSYLYNARFYWGIEKWVEKLVPGGVVLWGSASNSNSSIGGKLSDVKSGKKIASTSLEDIESISGVLNKKLKFEKAGRPDKYETMGKATSTAIEYGYQDDPKLIQDPYPDPDNGGSLPSPENTGTASGQTVWSTWSQDKGTDRFSRHYWIVKNGNWVKIDLATEKEIGVWNRMTGTIDSF
jgi:RHS repeat-associated protein